MSESRRGVRSAAFVLCALLLAGGLPAYAAPGNAVLALEAGPAAGDFDLETYLRDPSAFPAQSADHPDGWAIAYRHANPPPGWTRPFFLRGGGRAAWTTALNPRYAAVVEEMLPVRATAMLALHAVPDSAASDPGKPNPYPLYRDGWLFVHDGFLDIESLTMGIWRAEAGAAWEAFKQRHPRDYNGNGDSTRGCAGEIYFLALLHEIENTPADVPGALWRTVLKLLALQGWETWQMNAVLQGDGCTWALRFAPARAEDYRLYYGLTTQGEHCIVDSLPGAGTWSEIPNYALGIFPAGGAGQIQTLPASGVSLPEEGEGAGEHLRPHIRLGRCPALGYLSLSLILPGSRGGRLEIWDIAGRRVADLALRPGPGHLRWEPPAEVGSGVLWIRLRSAGGTARRQVLFLR